MAPDGFDKPSKKRAGNSCSFSEARVLTEGFGKELISGHGPSSRR